MSRPGGDPSELQFFADLIRSAMDAIISADALHRIILFNHAAEEMFGWTAAEAVGQPLNLLIPGRFHHSHTRQVHHFGETLATGRKAGQLGVVIGQRKDGREFPVEASISRSTVGSEPRFTVILRDVTYRLQAEEAVRQRLELESRLARIVAVAPGVLYTFRRAPDGAMSFPYVSEGFKRLLGVDPTHLQEDASAAFQRIHPDDLARVLQSTEQSARDLCDWRQEFRVGAPDGRVNWIQGVSSPMREPDGSVVWNGFLVDITEQKLLEQQLQQALKMEAIGRLAGGIAHDFNNLLMVMVGYGELLRERLPPGDPNAGYARHILDATERATALTRQLLAFSRKQVMAPKVVDLNRVVANTETMLRRVIGEDIILTTVLQPTPAMVMIDPGQIEQAILNLAVNSRDAMPHGGSLTVDVRQVVLTEDYHRANPYSRPGRHVLLAVCDTGVGMTPEVRSRAFEPFFTTKESGKGTGLGLASVFGIVKQSEGHVQLYSELGVGTCIKIYLPAVDGAGEQRVDLPREEPVRHGTETVLLVEDEEDVRRLTVLALESFGYTVLHAGNGPAALDLASSHPGPIHLMVTDVIMPGLSGSETAARLRQARPEARVLFMSGYIDDAVVRHGILAANEAYLQKPFTPLDFARKVREILDRH